MAQKVRLKKSNVPDKIPTASTMDYGELYINYASGVGKSFLATRKVDDTVAQFMEKSYGDKLYASKAEASEYAGAALANAMAYTDELAITGAQMSNTATTPSISANVLTIPTVAGYQGNQGWQGPKGNQGNQGWQGPKGNQGNQGWQGPKGNQGNQGWQGLQGWQGWQGPKGNQGNQGWQGPKGAKGDRGYQGWQGLQGWQGWQGPKGNQGNQGWQGPKGNQGNQGWQGPKGNQGNQGWQGPKGNQGNQGWQGPKGNQGNQGWQGPIGPVFNVTTTSTKHYFLGLNNTTATVGANTVHTDTGISFTNGVISATNVNVGGILFTDLSTRAEASEYASIALENAMAYTDELAITGAQMSNTATTPSISDNVLTIPTVAGNQGRQGPKGNQGNQGWQGPKGNQGSQGWQGPKGNQGSQGWQGPKGNQGSQGWQGPKGNQGSQGWQGPKGNQGSQGWQGPKGNQGSQGWQGPIGPVFNVTTATSKHYLLGLNNTAATVGSNTVHTMSDAYMQNGVLYATLNSLPESRLAKGNTNLAGDLYVGDHIYNEYMNANRLSGLRAAGITVEYTINGGTTWADYGASDINKRNLFTNRTSGFKLGGVGHDATDKSGHWLRVIINTSSGGVYTSLSKFNIYMSTNYSTGCTVTIDAALESDPTNFSKVVCTNQAINGWSGWNVINYPSGVVTYGNTPDTQYGRIRFTFKQGGLSSASKSAQGASIYTIFGYGGMGWTTPSNMALNGHAYSYDGAMNVVFPNQLDARVIKSTVTGSTAPFIVSSTAVTTNLNADLLDGKHGSYYAEASKVVTGAQMSNTATSPSVSANILTIPTVAGYQGRQGWQGPKGNQGSQGWQGPKGNQGNQGWQGPKGNQGNQGWQGPKGNQGNQGWQGPKGNQGNQGWQGPKGNQGNQGWQGPKGNQGNQGWQGPIGPVFNVTTASTKHYLLGLNNTAATVGANTVHTDTGISFTNGVISAKNVNVGGVLFTDLSTKDESAEYAALALANSIVYTDELAITGVQMSNTATIPSISDNVLTIPTVAGNQGRQGPKGNQGNQGWQGPKGNQGSQGWQGPKGNQGSQGWQGPKGQATDGTQGRQGWQGPKGQATNGTQGRQGWQGPKGQATNGTQGRQGWQGPKGQATDGTQGRQGWQGWQGPKGNQGNQGWQGWQGPKGQATNGTNGKQGRQGWQGPIGPVFNITTGSGTLYFVGMNVSSGTIGASTMHTDKYVYASDDNLFANIINTNDVFTDSILFKADDDNGPAIIGENISGVPIVHFYGIAGDEGAILRNVENPIDDKDAANKRYVDTTFATKAEASEYAAAALANSMDYTDLLAITGAQMSSTATTPTIANNMLTIPTVAGYQGRQGWQGPNGNQGRQGWQGPKGNQGSQGWQGPKGQATDGTQGRQGWQGPKGQATNGINGTQGRQGWQGPKGSDASSITITGSANKRYLLGIAGTTSNNTFNATNVNSNSNVYMQSGLIYSTSDENLKNFKGDIKCDFNELKSIPKKYFEWKSGEPPGIQIGTSAQELAKYYPELVSADENGEYAVSYERLSVIALAAVDKLYDEIVNIKAVLKTKYGIEID